MVSSHDEHSVYYIYMPQLMVVADITDISLSVYGPHVFTMYVAKSSTTRDAMGLPITPSEATPLFYHLEVCNDSKTTCITLRLLGLCTGTTFSFFALGWVLILTISALKKK